MSKKYRPLFPVEETSRMRLRDFNPVRIHEGVLDYGGRGERMSGNSSPEVETQEKGCDLLSQESSPS